MSDSCRFCGELVSIYDAKHHCEGMRQANEREAIMTDKADRIEPPLDPPAEISEADCRWELCAEMQELSDMEECVDCSHSHWYCDRPELGMSCYELHRLACHDHDKLADLWAEHARFRKTLYSIIGDIREAVGEER